MKTKLLTILLLYVTLVSSAQTKIVVRLDSTLKGTYSGRLYVETLNDTTKQFGQANLGPQARFAIPVQNWKNHQQVQVGPEASHSLVPMDELKPGYYKVVAVLDVDSQERSMHSPGNLYSRREAVLHVTEGGRNEVTVTINSTFIMRQFRETTNIKELQHRSALLSAFHKKPVFIKAGIVLPESYFRDSTRRYPTVFIIPGWGGTHYDASGSMPAKRYGFNLGKEKIFVYLNPETQTPFGLHAFVDSRVNGPWGKALVEELIPALEKQYRVSTEPDHRFLLGQSTGGYATAWLMLHYPKAFASSWGTAPDPVDFSSFTGVNLYQDKNYYQDATGKERGFYKLHGKYQTTMRLASREEIFEGGGGQQQSFEAEFGKLAPNGKPKPLFDAKTGVIDKNVVNDWKEYDLGLFVLRNWKNLKKDLDGKIHLYAGSEDNFGLNHSLMKFRKKAKAVGADIVIEEIPSTDHFSIWSGKFTQRIHQEIDSLLEVARARSVASSHH